MDADDLILVSVDDHVVEPPGMFEAHLPAKYRGREPEVITKDDGTEAWVFEGQRRPTWASTRWPGGRPTSTALSRLASARCDQGASTSTSGSAT